MSSPHLPSLQLPERYRPLSILGRGAMGIVLRALDRELDRTVAIKVMVDAGFGDDRARFHRELTLLSQLEHPRVVRVYDFELDDDRAYFVMELLEGVPLSRRPSHAFGVSETRRLLEDLLDPLGFIHSRGVLHRDLKPTNILDVPGRGLVLIDFGLARNTDASERLTAEGSVVGTMAFLAPEALRDRSESPRGDLFSLAVIAYQLLLGERLHAPEKSDLEFGPRDLLSSLMSGSYHDLAARRLVPFGPFGRLLLRALDPDPEARFQTAGDLAAALAATPDAAPSFGDPDEPTARTPVAGTRAMPAAPAPPPPPAPGSRGALGALAVVAALSLGVLAGAMAPGPTAPDPTAPTPGEVPQPSPPPAAARAVPDPAGGVPPLLGTRVFTRDLEDLPGLGPKVQGADKLTQFLASAGKYSPKLIFRVPVAALAPATRAWVVLHAPGVHPGQRVGIDLNERGQATLTPPRAGPGVLAGRIDVGLLDEGENEVRLWLLPPTDPEIPQQLDLEDLQLHLEP